MKPRDIGLPTADDVRGIMAPATPEPAKPPFVGPFHTEEQCSHGCHVALLDSKGQTLIVAPRHEVQRLCVGLNNAPLAGELTLTEQTEVNRERARADCGVSSAPNRVRVLLAIISRLTGVTR